MDGAHRRVCQQERQKFESEVNDEFEKIKLEMESIQITVEPNDIEITSQKRGFWEHEVVNESLFEVVVRIRATTSRLFTVDRNVFRIGPGQVVVFKITRADHRICSHHIKLDVTRYTSTSNPRNMHDYFGGSFPHKTFIIRYHGAPRYWEDALELNNWCPDVDLTAKMKQEMKRTSREWKTSAEGTEKEGTTTNSEQELEETSGRNEAKVNLANVMLMAIQDIKEVDYDSDGDFEDACDDMVTDVNEVMKTLMLDPTVSE